MFIEFCRVPAEVTDGSRQRPLDCCHLHITQRFHSQPSSKAAILMWSELDKKTLHVFISHQAPSSCIQPWQVDTECVCILRGLREVHPSYSCLLLTGSSLLSTGCVCVCGWGSRVERSVEVWPWPCVKLLTYATVAGVRDTWWMLFAIDWGALNHSQLLCCFAWGNGTVEWGEKSKDKRPEFVNSAFPTFLFSTSSIWSEFGILGKSSSTLVLYNEWDMIVMEILGWVNVHQYLSIQF